MSTTPITFPLPTIAAAANAYAAAHGIQVEQRTTPTTTTTTATASSSSFPTTSADTPNDSTTSNTITTNEDSVTNGSTFQCAPMSLLPNAFPALAFAEAVALAPTFNLLVDRVSRDAVFLQRTLGGSVAAADPYTAKLLQLYLALYVVEPSLAALSADRMGIHRSDYMLNPVSPKTRERLIMNSRCDYEIKQVELNTIAASFAGLACRVSQLHSFLLQRYEAQENGLTSFLQENEKAVTTNTLPKSQPNGVPNNPALQSIPAAFQIAVERYQQRFASSQLQEIVAVLFVVQEGETNTVDQRLLEFHLFDQYQIPVIRLSLRQIQSQVQRTTEGALTMDNIEFAVVYFRAGYAPTDYPDGLHGVEWQAREMLEDSRATKCPSLGYHLAGTKKVQQELARPGVLEQFCDTITPEDVILMRKAFAGLYSLGEDATSMDLEAVQDVLQGNHGRYVLKPQREGGGYNFYGDELATKLRENVIVNPDGTIALDPCLGEYILMDRLFPPEQMAILLRGGRVEGTGPSVSELGCFGTIVVTHNGHEVVHNDYAGFLLRTKFSNVDEGGVASGFATLSSPYLC